MRYQRIKKILIYLFLVLIVFYFIFAVEEYSKREKNNTNDQKTSISPQTSPTVDLKKDNDLNSALTKEIDPNLKAELVTSLKHINFIGNAVIVRNGKITANYSNGFSNVSIKEKNTTNTIFNINSMQKSFTAILLMQLVEDGRVSLESPLSHYYPEVPNSNMITLRQMLDMTSGLSMNSMGTGQWISDEITIKNDIERLRFKTSMYNQFDYQPVNYVLLAGIIEKVTGQTYQKILIENIIKRLSLRYVAFGYDLKDSDHAAESYTGPQNSPYFRTWPLDINEQHYELGTGQLFMSIADYYLCIRSMLDGTLISIKSANQLFTAGSTKFYGGGFYNYGEYKSSNGTGMYFGSTIRISDDGKNAILLFSNYGNDYAQLKDVANHFWKAYFDY